MDFIDDNQPFFTPIQTLTNIFDSPQGEFDCVYLISFCQLLDGQMDDVLIDGDFEVEDDLGNVTISRSEARCEFPNFLDNSQIDSLISICDVSFHSCEWLNIVIPLFTFKHVWIEELILDTPVRDRPFFLHSGMQPWFRALESFIHGGPLDPTGRGDVDEHRWELAVLKRDLQQYRFAFAFQLLFYGTPLLEYVRTGRILPGLRGGVKNNRKKRVQKPAVVTPARVEEKKEEKKQEKKEPQYMPAPDFAVPPPSASAIEPWFNDIERMASEFDAQIKQTTQCYNCKKIGHVARNCPAPRLCNRCNKPGHMSKQCPSSKGGATRHKKKTNLVAASLISSLQQAQGEQDALRAVIRDQEEQIQEEFRVSEVPRTPTQEKEKDVPRTPQLPIIKPKTTGINFRTHSGIFYSRQVRYTPTLMTLGITQVYSFLQRTVPFPLSNIMTKISNVFQNRYMKAIASIFGFYSTEYIRPPPQRLGGLLHSISTEKRIADTSDVRLDYLAVGDLKHEDPEYCYYVVTKTKVTSTGFWSFVLPMSFEFNEDLTEEKLTDTIICKEAFKNAVSFRISPMTSDESARNSVKLGLTKLASINHSRHFIEQNSVLNGTSDEALTRTYEAIMAFREHLKEELVMREAHKEILFEGNYPACGVFTPSRAFVEKILN
jgi:hypothetical protein